jgi:hypothetical protein
MRNSRGGLGDIPSPGRAGAPPAFARSGRATARELVSAPKSRAFRQKAILASRRLTSNDFTPKHRGRHDVALVGICPTAGDGRRRPAQAVPVGVDMLNIGNGAFLDFHEADGNHFQPTCWKCEETREPAISRCPKLISSNMNAGPTVRNGEWLSGRLEPSSDEASAVVPHPVEPPRRFASLAASTIPGEVSRTGVMPANLRTLRSSPRTPCARKYHL